MGQTSTCNLSLAYNQVVPLHEKNLPKKFSVTGTKNDDGFFFVESVDTGLMFLDQENYTKFPREYYEQLNEDDLPSPEDRVVKDGKIGGFLLKNLEIKTLYQMDELHKDFFLAQYVIFHSSFSRDGTHLMVFPKCEYLAKKIRITINSDRVTRLQKFFINNKNCPVEIEFFVHGEKGSVSEVHIFCTKPELLKVTNPDDKLDIFYSQVPFNF